MKTLILGVAACGVIAISAPAFAGQAAPTKTEMMKTCMDKQKAERSQMPPADMKKFCTQTISEQKVSSGPQTATLDTPKK